MEYHQKYYILISTGNKVFVGPPLIRKLQVHAPGRSLDTSTGLRVLKKAMLFFILAGMALLLDGTLSYDIFDLHRLSVSGWLGLLLVVLIFTTIAWAESSKKGQRKNNLR